MREAFFVNVNFVCNERCVFCAADLADGGWTVEGRRAGVTLDDVRAWTRERPPGPDDEVAIAGGEPTLHPGLAAIVRHLAAGGAPVTVFTNGLRLADAGYARGLLDAGVSRFEIALFGASAATHEAVTRRPGSFEVTVEALRVLGALHSDFAFTLEVRLLAARQCLDENPAVVRLLSERVAGVDVISLNRVILSGDADAAGAAVSWDEARASVNETARAVLDHGYELGFDAVPLCVYEGAVAAHVRARVAERRARGPAGLAPPQMRYLDPRSAAGREVTDGRALIALPPPCRRCDLLAVCGRVEQWYVERFGAAGLEPIHLGAGAGATARVG